DSSEAASEPLRARDRDGARLPASRVSPSAAPARPTDTDGTASPVASAPVTAAPESATDHDGASEPAAAVPVMAAPVRLTVTSPPADSSWMTNADAQIDPAPVQLAAVWVPVCTPTLCP